MLLFGDLHRHPTVANGPRLMMLGRGNTVLHPDALVAVVNLTPDPIFRCHVGPDGTDVALIPADGLEQRAWSSSRLSFSAGAAATVACSAARDLPLAPGQRHVVVVLDRAGELGFDVITEPAWDDRSHVDETHVGLAAYTPASALELQLGGTGGPRIEWVEDSPPRWAWVHRSNLGGPDRYTVMGDGIVAQRFSSATEDATDTLFFVYVQATETDGGALRGVRAPNGRPWRVR